MRLSRWLDHLPPWVSFGAVAGSGLYDPGEVAAMAAPLLAAAAVEGARLDLGRWRRWLEVATLLFIGLDAARRPGVLTLTVHTLFLLCGVRLVLPREMAQRRQVLLMAFLLFLTLSVSTVDLAFLGWATAWLLAATAVMLQQAWDGSAQFRRGPVVPPPFKRLPPWAGATLLLAASAFLVLPRISMGWRPLPWRISGLGHGQAGFTDKLELAAGGPLAGNSQVALRILPPPNAKPTERLALAERLSLLRGISLEAFDGRRWEGRREGFARGVQMVPPHEVTQLGRPLEFYISPNPAGILPLPYGHLQLQPPPGLPLRDDGEGSAIRWAYPPGNPVALRLGLPPSPYLLREPGPRGLRAAVLTYTGPEAELARRWSARLAPGTLAPRELASRLAAELQDRFAYTLTNPSGRAADPLEDFLERSHAGHCEYFASALALMLRVRGVPARIVNGYRLGAWIPEGGYWLVTQNEAHSWVEYFDPERGWLAADPTPAAPPSGPAGATFAASMERWMDALRFRWDRHVVRYSGEDQLAGLAWVQDRLSHFGAREPTDFTARGALGATLVALAAAWLAWRTRAFWRRIWSTLRPPREAGGIAALRPLLRRTRKQLEVREGDTARAWLLRLAALRPDRRDALLALAALVDEVVYGRGNEASLRAKVREEARAWRGGRQGSGL